MANSINFVIVGAGRGGTSLLAGLIDSHPMIEVGFELHSIATLMGGSSAQTTGQLFDDRVSTFIQLCQESASASKKQYWGNKITTEQIAGLEEHNALNPDSIIDVFDHFFNCYLKNIPILFILRDGRSCITSKVSRTGQSFEMACQRWLYSVACYKFLQERHSNNICIRFEELLHAPETTLRSICYFLGLNYTSEMLNGVGNSKMLPEYQQNSINQSKANTRMIEPQYFNVIKDALSYCHYI